MFDGAFEAVASTHGHHLLQEHRVFKRYLALCTGRVEPPQGSKKRFVFLESF